MKKSDRELGMDREINRRDFLSGTSIAIAGAVLGPGAVDAQGRDGGSAPASAGVDRTLGEESFYPPTRTGATTRHPGYWAVSVSDGSLSRNPTRPR